MEVVEDALVESITPRSSMLELSICKSYQPRLSSSATYRHCLYDADAVKLFKKINKKLGFIQRETFRMSFAVPASTHSSVYRGAAIAAYEPAGKAAATAATLRCLITNKYYPADQVVAAHIYQLRWPQAIPVR
jgi:hypothetical protein